MTEVPPTSPSSRGGRSDRSDDPLIRFDARVLDPATAVRTVDAKPPLPTVYRNNRLLVSAADEAELRRISWAIDKVLTEMGGSPGDQLPQPGFQRRNFDALNPSRRPVDEIRFARQADGSETAEPDAQEPSGADETGEEWIAQSLRLRRASSDGLPLAAVIPVEPRLERGRSEAAMPLDMYEVLQRMRLHQDAAVQDASKKVGLEHLLATAGTLAPYGPSLSPYGPSLSPYGPSLSPYGPSLNAGGVLSYLYPGTGGRAPASIVLNLPQVTQDGPRVVVLDTGCDQDHPWFEEKNGVPQVSRHETVSDGAGGQRSIGVDMTDQANWPSDPDGPGECSPDPMTGALKPAIGHGTFITGILRQKAPSARIASLRIADADGIVPEGAVVAAVTDLVAKQQDEPGWADVLVLSLGYYSETPREQQEISALGVQLATLAELGVAIFAAAGNDSTNRPFFPAAFAHSSFAPGTATSARMPFVSVAALNPDSSVALFSNDGDWVNAEAPGANVVSTFPTCLQGPWQPAFTIGPARSAAPGPAAGGQEPGQPPLPRVRTTIDPDHYSGGFGLWSGTSFAAPVVAGEYVARLTGTTALSSATTPQALTAIIRERRQLLAEMNPYIRTDNSASRVTA